MSRDLKTVSQFASQSVWTEPAIRWMIFCAATNGFQGHSVLVRCGRRIYIDTANFDRWLDAQNPQAGAA